jgi:hypothetical protein
VSGDTLFLSDPYGGSVTALDISSISAPKLIGELELSEHPGFVVEVDGVALVPAGYQGLLAWNYRAKPGASIAGRFRSPARP